MTTVRVLSQNLNCHYLTRGSTNKEQRMQAFSERLNDYDIVIIQELFEFKLFGYYNTGFTQYIIDRAGEYDLLYSARDQVCIFIIAQGNGVLMYQEDVSLGQNCGLVILSRYPIISQRFLVREGHWADPGTKKGAISAVVQVCLCVDWVD